MKINYGIEASAFSSSIKLVFSAYSNDGRLIMLPPNIASILTATIQYNTVIPKGAYNILMDAHLETVMEGHPTRPVRILWCDCEPVEASIEGCIKAVNALVRRKNVAWEADVIQEYAAMLARKLKEYLENARISFPEVDYKGTV